ncbi:MAG: WG repeat-containing protein [Leptospiraceae bacterium]|nr:WG repeat-containing protein [Leptospiraceae bacterium]
MPKKINIEDISISQDETKFLYEGKILFSDRFLKVLAFHPPGIAAVSDTEGWYHIDLNGKPLYLKRFDRCFGFYFDRAVVVDGNRWYHIDDFGNKTYSPSYPWCGNFQEKLCTVRDDSHYYFHINLFGERIYDHQYIYAGDFYEGVACVQLQNGNYKHILKDGSDLNGREFKDLGVFHKSFAMARDEKGWFHINKSGDEMYSSRYYRIEPFYNGASLVENFDSKKLIIDESGNTVLLLE